MNDRHRLKRGPSAAFALRLHPPNVWDEPEVAEYNEIVAELHSAEPDRELLSFLVPASESVPRVSTVTRGSIRGPGEVFYTSKRYCDTGKVLRRVESVAAYLDAARVATPDVSTSVVIESSAVSAAERPRRLRSFIERIWVFVWSLVKDNLPALFSAWLKRKGWE